MHTETAPYLAHAFTARVGEFIQLRRDIHSHPELGFQEHRTAALVADTLREIGGFEVRTQVGKTGVVASMGTGDGPTIGIRADMDALPLHEANSHGFASQTPGAMHACGRQPGPWLFLA